MNKEFCDFNQDYVVKYFKKDERSILLNDKINNTKYKLWKIYI